MTDEVIGDIAASIPKSNYNNVHISKGICPATNQQLLCQHATPGATCFLFLETHIPLKRPRVQKPPRKQLLVGEHGHQG